MKNSKISHYLTGSIMGTILIALSLSGSVYAQEEEAMADEKCCNVPKETWLPNTMPPQKCLAIPEHVPASNPKSEACSQSKGGHDSSDGTGS